MGKIKISDFAKTYPSKTYPKGEMIVYSGQAPKTLFYLKKGYIRQYITSNEGKDLTIHIYEPGSILPLNWALNNVTIDFNLEALTTCNCNLVPVSEFVNFIRSDNFLLMDITKRMLKGIEGLSKRLEIVTFDNANERVMATLLYLQRHFGNKYHFSHEDIASLTGLTRERVSIEMKRLKDQGKVNYRHANVTLVTDTSSK